MDSATMDQFSELSEASGEIKRQQKALADREKLLREELLELMLEQGIDNGSCKSGSVYVQRRQEKDYGDYIRSLEVAYKEAKKLADDLDDYKVLNAKETLVFKLATEE
jgi:gamma-glutamylcysteine synthetase